MRKQDVRDVANLANEVSQMALALLKRDAENKGPRIDYDHAVYTAALRRRSMDLTRALARLRHPWRVDR